MKALDRNQNEIYKFLGCKQAERTDIKKVMKRLLIQIEQRTRKVVGEELHDKNLVKAINYRVIPVAAYITNVCNFTGKELDKIDKGIKKILRENNIHRKQCSDERLYIRTKLGGRGIKSLKDVYEEKKLRVACYMMFSSSIWLKEAWKRKMTKNESQSKRKQKKH